MWLEKIMGLARKYAYAVSEPSTHAVYLARIPLPNIKSADISTIEWWNNHEWTQNKLFAATTTPLFIGQTEFSVHFDPILNQFIQIQTHGFGAASIGYRTASQIQGPWSEPVIFYTPKLEHKKHFVYTANAHPEIDIQDGILITYNINSGSFEQLIEDETIYFPKTIKLKINQ